MSDWKEYSLGNLVELVIDYRGKTPLKLGGNWSFSGYRALSAKNIKTGQIVNEESIRFVDEDLYRKWMKDEVQRGDILITSEAPFGQILFWDSDEKIVLSQRLFCLRISSRACPRFVYYYMTTHTFQHELDGRATGTTVIGLRQPELLKCRIKLPTYKEQVHIANILKSFDDKIECNRRINENLEQQAQALFKSWFVDFEPFKDQPFVESELGMIPQGWRVECLNEFGKIVCGKTPSKAESSYYGGNIPFVKIPDMHNNIFVLHSEDCLSDLGDKSQVGKRIPPYSVLVSCIATVGLVGMNVRTCHTNQQINTIIPNSIEYRYYLYQKLVSLREYLINLGRGGTATLNVNTRQFGNIRIVRPSDKVLSEYHQRISCLFDKIEINSLESRRLAELRDTLLPKLMSGELKVGEINV